MTTEPNAGDEFAEAWAQALEAETTKYIDPFADDDPNWRRGDPQGRVAIQPHRRKHEGRPWRVKD